MHPHQIGQCRAQLLDGAAAVFAEGRPVEPPVDVKTLHAKIGEITEMQSEKADILVSVCQLLSAADREGAASLARAEYPFEGRQAAPRRYSRHQAMRLFVRDGFIDRYSGKRLVFPGTLLLFSRLLPVEFPTHPNWKMSATHFAYWELWPTIDHQVPITREGRDELSNWVTTSVMANAAKRHWSLSELAWTLLPPGDCRVWDGLTAWCCELISREPIHLKDRALAGWCSAAMRAIRA